MAQTLSIRGQIFAAFGFIISVLYLSTGWITYYEYQHEMDSAHREMRNLVSTLGEHADRTFSRVESVLDDGIEQVAKQGAEALSPLRLRGLINRNLMISNLLMVDAHGDVQAAAYYGGEWTDWQFDPETIKTWLDGIDGVDVSPAFRGQDGEWMIPVSRIWQDHHRGVKGFLVALIPSNYFAETYRALDLGESGVLSLLTQQGRLLARSPMLERMMSKSLHDAPAFQMMNEQTAGSFEVVYLHNDQLHISGFNRLNPWGVVVLAAQEKQELLAPWRQAAVGHLAMAVVISLILLGTGYELARLVSRKRKAERRTEEAERLAAELSVSEERLRLALKGGQLGLWDWQVQSGEALFDKYWCEILGHKGDELPAQIHTWLERIHPDDRAQMDEAFVTHFVGGSQVYECRHRLQHRNGDWVWVVARGRVMEWNKFGEPTRVIGTLLDITAQQDAQQRLMDSEKRFRAIFDQLPQLAALVDPDGYLLEANRAALELIERDAQEVLGERLWQAPWWRASPNLQRQVEAAAVRCRNGEEVRFEVSHQGKLNQYCFDFTLSPVFDDAHQVVMGVAQAHDLTERKTMELKLRESESRFRTMFLKHSSVMLLIEPNSGQIEDANEAAAEFYGYSIKQLLQMSIGQINTLSPEKLRELRSRAADYSQQHFIFPHRLSNGEIRSVEVHSSPMQLNQRTVLFSIIHDVTEREHAQERVRLLAMQDHLTGLANRTHFRRRFAEMLLHAKGTGSDLYLMLLDLDRFKPVNDTYGHPVGDKVLIAVAEIFRHHCRDDYDLVARLGGDEFAVLLSNPSSKANVRAIAERILAEFKTPLLIDQEAIELGVSIGVVCYPKDGDQQDLLVQRADQALYRAKRERMAVEFYSDSGANSVES